jgi:hypothetical protein
LRPAVLRQARALIAKGNGLGFVQLTNGLAMDSPAIDNAQTRAICDEIGERLRALLKSPVSRETPDLEEKLRQLSGKLAEPEFAD